MLTCARLSVGISLVAALALADKFPVRVFLVVLVDVESASCVLGTAGFLDGYAGGATTGIIIARLIHPTHPDLK